MINFRKVIDFLCKPYVACIVVGFEVFYNLFISIYGEFYDNMELFNSSLLLLVLFIVLSFVIPVSSIFRKGKRFGGALYLFYFLFLFCSDVYGVEVVRLVTGLKITFQSKKYEACAERATPIDGGHMFAVCDWHDLFRGERSVAIVYDSSGKIANYLDKKEHKFFFERMDSSFGTYDDYYAVRAVGYANFYRVEFWFN